MHSAERTRLRILAGRPFLRAWLSAFVPLAAIGILWAAGNPLGNSPDEPTHVIRAVSVVHGQLVGPHNPGSPTGWTRVEVAGTYNRLQLTPICYHFVPTQAASCAPALRSDPTLVHIGTYVGHYPPLYYLIVGLPSLVSSSPHSVFAMRAVSVLLDMAVLALAFAVARCWSRSELLMATIAAVSTPMALWLASTVNPSGLEITASVTMWVSLSVLALDHPANPPRGLLVTAAAAMALLASARGPSPLWVAVALVGLLPVAAGRLDLAALARRTDARVVAAALAVVALLDAAWIIFANGLQVAPSGVPPASEPTSRVYADLVRRFGTLLMQAVGNFGWLDTPAPAIAVILVAIAVALPLGLVVATGGRRHFASLLAITGIGFALPFVLTAMEVRHVGPGIQARYFMPLWVGTPIFAAAVVRTRSLGADRVRRLVATSLACSTAGLIVCFYWFVHRLAVGIGGPYSPFAHPPGSWSPPLSQAAYDGLFSAVAVVYGLVVYLLVRNGRARLRRESGRTGSGREPVLLSGSPGNEGLHPGPVAAG